MLKDIKKQGSNDYGIWVIGTLEYNGFVINDLFSTNLKSELDSTKSYEVKSVKIIRNKSNVLRFQLIF